MSSLYKRKGSPRWYMRGTVRERSYNQSTGEVKKARARRVQEATEEALFNGGFTGQPTVSFSAAADDYMNDVERKDRLLVMKLVKHFGDTPLAEIGQSAVDDAAKALYRTAKPQTLNRHVYTPISAIMRRAARRGLVSWVPLERPKVRDMPIERWCKMEEAERFLEHADDDLAGAFIYLLYTGCRISEMLGLRWEDVDLHRRHITLREFKTRELRPVAIASEVFDVLANMESREGFVFPWRDRKQVYRLWNPCCNAAGIVGLTPHKMRHTFATWLRVYRKKDLRFIMQAGGWKDIKSVARYTHVDSDEVRAEIDMLPKVKRQNV